MSLGKDMLTLELGLQSASAIACLVQKANKNHNCRKQQWLKFTEHLLNAKNFSLHYLILLTTDNSSL